MKKLLLSSLAATAFSLPLSASANSESLNDLGVAINYGLFSGPTLELSYPIAENLQVRGALSSGMSISQTSQGSATEPDYAVSADGGIHRLALDYHPFGNGFFMSAGYAVNNFKLNANASESGSVVVGDQTFNADIEINSSFSWDNAPTISLGWGHSPDTGLGFMIEAGAYFTGAPTASLDGTCDDGGSGACAAGDFTGELENEKVKLQAEVADFDFLPMIQAGVTYRF